MDTLIEVRKRANKIADVLNGLIVGYELTHDEKFEFSQYTSSRKDFAFRRCFVLKRQHKLRDIRDFTIDIMVLHDLRMCVRVREEPRNDSLWKFNKSAYDLEGLYSFQLDVQDRYTDIFFDEPTDLVEIFDVLFNYSKLVV